MSEEKIIKSSIEELEKNIDKYGFQLGLYELMAELDKLRAENKSLRGTCKSYAKKIHNQGVELARLNKTHAKTKVKLHRYKSCWYELKQWLKTVIDDSKAGSGQEYYLAIVHGFMGRLEIESEKLDSEEGDK